MISFLGHKVNLFSFVTDNMPLETKFCSEYLLTALALIFDPFMFLHVNCIIRSSIKAFPALVTVIAVLPDVYLHVLIQVSSGGIFLYTQSAVKSVSVFLRPFNRSVLLLLYNNLSNLCASTKRKHHVNISFNYETTRTLGG